MAESEVISQSSTQKSPHLAFSVSNVKLHVPIQLSFSQPNYKKWSRLFLLLARRFNLQGYLNGSIAPISDDDDEWFQLDAVLQGWILSTITDEVSDLVISSVSTASALWKVIHDLFHDNKHARAMQLEHQFRTTVKGSTPMATYCQELRNIADWLDDVDAPVSEHQLVLQMSGRPSFSLTDNGPPWAAPAARRCWRGMAAAATPVDSTAGLAGAAPLTVATPAVGDNFLAAAMVTVHPPGSVAALDTDKGVATATGVVVEGAKTADRGSDHPRTGTIPGTHRTLSHVSSQVLYSPHYITVGNGSKVRTTAVGNHTLPTTPPLSLNNILISPHITHNLISVRKLTRDNDCTVEFDAHGFSVKDRQTGTVMHQSNNAGPLYPVDHPTSAQAHVSSVDHQTWHRRLGHPSPAVLRGSTSP
ncbi:unnamed protein product [Cuscuta campestris]|uniref:GAG-pre-integrase domain-containing protein n=1 Tax=Cuscuta campestris TaxID=132261 RepID=A0A484KTK5_9ASTE|nr:unnamed protein product [Cuscuta campestris]